MSNTVVPQGHHLHKCEECGTIWHHEDSCREATDEINEKAHTCPKCGEQEFYIYFGEAQFIVPNLCNTTCQKEKMSVEDYLYAIGSDTITAGQVAKMDEVELLIYVVTGRLPADINFR